MDSEELFPSLCSDTIGEVLKVIRTGSGVNDFVEVSLFLEKELLVACDTLSELGRTLVGHVKRRNNDFVHTCKGSRHSLSLCAEEVNVSVEDSHVEATGLGADIHLSSLFEGVGEDRRFVSLDDLSPEQTSCAELSNLHEVIAADTHIETDFTCCEVVRHTGFGHHRHVLSTPSKCVRELLCTICAGVIKDDAVDAYDAVVNERFASVNDFCELGSDLFAAEVFALEEHVLNRVHIDGTIDSLEIVSATAVVTHEDVGELGSFASADSEVDVNRACINVLE